jgi:hypothetical protein
VAGLGRLSRCLTLLMVRESTSRILIIISKLMHCGYYGLVGRLRIQARYLMYCPNFI